MMAQMELVREGGAPVRPGAPYVPPHPEPPARQPTLFQALPRAYRNPIEVWGAPAFDHMALNAWRGPFQFVVLNDPAVLRRVLVAEAADFPFAPVRQSVLRPVLGEGLLTAQGNDWRRARRAMAPGFAPASMRPLAGTMLDVANRFAARYAAAPMRTDVARDMLDLSFDLTEATLFSGAIAGGHDLAELLERVLEMTGRVDPLDLAGAPLWVPRPTKLRGRASLKALRRMIRATADARRDTPDDRREPDLLDRLLAAEREGAIDAQSVEDNVVTFIAAGHDTIARALGWTLHCLAGSDWDRGIVEAEIDAAWDGLGTPDTWVDALPRTRAAFEEAMRLYPPVAAIVRYARHDCELGGIAVRAGGSVAAVPWTLHRHRALWDEPNAFRPERFWPENRDDIDRFQYLPFGAGPRVCIGQTFAMWEGVIALAVLLRRYRFTSEPGAPVWPVQKVTTQPGEGLPMRVTRR